MVSWSTWWLLTYPWYPPSWPLLISRGFYQEPRPAPNSLPLWRRMMMITFLNIFCRSMGAAPSLGID